jgi:hypothetical protein
MQVLKVLVGERGFEPPTPWSRTRCSTRLSHSPTEWKTIRKKTNAQPDGGADSHFESNYNKANFLSICFAERESLTVSRPDSPPPSSAALPQGQLPLSRARQDF